jgi:large subunit ribosomal protein L23
MDPTYIVKKPLITEKTTWEAGARNRYSFEVNPSADKPQIKAAVEALYNVRVQKISTQVRKGKYFRTKFGPAKTATWKRATVQLHEDDRIELF